MASGCLGGARRGAEHGGEHLVDVPGERREEPAVGRAVLAQVGTGVVHRGHTAPARPPSRGWAKATGGVSSFTPRAARSTLRKNGEARHQRVDRRAHVMVEPGQRQLGRAAAAAGASAPS